MLFDAFDEIRIVSLPERTDRRRDMHRQLETIGLDDDSRVIFFDALKTPTADPFRSAGSHGCFLSHLAILEEAAANQESVAILQDDCNFLPQIHSYELPKCDVFYGSHRSDSEVMIGAHFMGFSARAAKLAAEYLQHLLDPYFPPDTRAAREAAFDPHVRPPIDGSLVWFRRAYPNLKTVFALLGVQRPSRSDITPGRLDRIRIVRSAVGVVRRMF